MGGLFFENMFMIKPGAGPLMHTFSNYLAEISHINNHTVMTRIHHTLSLQERMQGTRGSSWQQFVD